MYWPLRRYPAAWLNSLTFATATRPEKRVPLFRLPETAKEVQTTHSHTVTRPLIIVKPTVPRGGGENVVFLTLPVRVHSGQEKEEKSGKNRKFVTWSGKSRKKGTFLKSQEKVFILK